MADRPRSGDAAPPSEAVGPDEQSAIGGDRVDLRSLTKRYDQEVAVDDVGLTVERGELLVLLGPSGCGKTTTLRMIAGLETVTSGSVSIGGVDVSRTSPQKRDVAMVFQNYALYPHKTVRENVAFPLKKTDLSADERADRVVETARLLDIADLLDKRPAALSGGQRQRVAIGRAIAREPAVLLMDEPLSNLDAKLRVRTRSELRRLQQRLGITTVYVTHDQEEAMSIADRIAIMNDGRIEQVGTPEAVYRDPTSAFIASFLGDPSMNVLTVEEAPAARADGPRAGDRRDGDRRGTDESTVSVTDHEGPAVDAGDEPAHRDFVATLVANAPAPDRVDRVGVRPEDCYLVTEEGPVATDAPTTLSAPHDCPLVVVEPIGRAYELTVRTGAVPSARTIVTRARDVPDAVRGADSVPVAFDTTAVYAFDAGGDRLR